MRRVALAAAAALVLLSACGDAEPSSPTAADLRAIDVSPDHTITVDEDGYTPSTLEVIAGDVIRLVNEGDEEHSFTADEQRFDTGRMQAGDDTTLVLTEPGEVRFHDLEEPDHEATLTVVPRS